MLESVGRHNVETAKENMSLEVREHNASALGRAIFFSCVVPSLISAPAFPFQSLPNTFCR